MVQILTTTFKFLLVILVFWGSFISSFYVANFFKIKDIRFMMIVTLILITFFLYILKLFKFKEVFGGWKIKKEIFFWSFIYMIANCFLNYIIDSLFHPSIPPSKIFDSKSLENLVFIAFLIPLMEEVVFRGIVCNILKNKFSMFITILISGLIFATIHWIPGITFIITGSTFYFGYIYLKTKSLWNPVIVHVINNSIAALIIILGKDEAIETINLGMFGYIVGSISLLLCFYNFYRMYKGIHFEKPLKIGEIKRGCKIIIFYYFARIQLLPFDQLLCYNDYKYRHRRKFMNKSTKKTKHLGAHVSVSGGVFNAPKNAHDIGGTAFAMFLKNQKRWVAKDYDDKVITKFKDEMKKYNFNTDYIMPHAGYLINLANSDPEKWQKSLDALIDELKRGEQLGLKYVNLHCGSHLGLISLEEGYDLIAKGINEAIKATEYITVVLENTAGKGNTIGGNFEELKGIIDRVENKDRIGVLLDTCHTFDYGYDLATEEGYEKTFEEFENLVGFKYLKGIHLNDSMYGLACKKDRHESIGNGMLGMDFFKRFMNDPRFDNMPITLETIDQSIWKEEIELLYSLITE